jgi:hypothetical protein
MKLGRRVSLYTGRRVHVAAPAAAVAFLASEGRAKGTPAPHANLDKQQYRWAATISGRRRGYARRLASRRSSNSGSLVVDLPRTARLTVRLARRPALDVTCCGRCPSGVDGGRITRRNAESLATNFETTTGVHDGAGCRRLLQLLALR